MTMPKKQTRSIVHKGETYRWRFGRGNPKGFHFVHIEKAEGKGQLLSIKFPSDIGDYWLDFSNEQVEMQSKNYKSLKTGMVKTFIEQALAMGWKCDLASKPFKLVADNQDKLKLDVE